MKLKKVMLSIGVGILSALFIGFLIEAIYPSPAYEDFCKNSFDVPPTQVSKQAVCDYTYDTTMRTTCTQNRGNIIQEFDSKGCVMKESCDYCQKDYQAADERYNRVLFYVTAPIGLVMILLGLYLPTSIDAISSGILFGGILTMLQITARVFGSLGRWPRVILLGLELTLVIWIGVKKVKDVVSKKR
jgi:hypothetical protein